MGAIAGRYELLRNDENIDAGHRRQQHVRRRHGDSQDSQVLEDGKGRFPREIQIPGNGLLTAVTAIEDGDDDEADDSTGNGTEGGTGRGPFQTVRQEDPGQGQHGADPDELVGHLGHGSRLHELQPLEIAAEATGHHGNRQGRRQHEESRQGPFIADEPPGDKALRAQDHRHAAQGGDDDHGSRRHVEDTPRAPGIALGRLLGYHDGDGNGNAGPGDGQEQDIDRIGHLVKAYPFAAEESR